MLTGWAGQLSLGQMAFAGIGALTAAALTRGLELDLGVVSLDFAGIPFLLSIALAGLVTAALGHVLAGAVMCITSIAIQGRAHRRERVGTRFSGPIDFARRLLIEQLVTFPRFVLSGRFGAMLKSDGARRPRREAGPARP